MSSAGPTQPWSLSDARSAFCTSAVGVGLLVWAWWESSSTGRLHRQTTWTVVGVLAVVLIAMGSFFWLSSGRRAVRLRRDALAIRIHEIEHAATSGTPGLSVTTGPFVALPGSGRYHRAGCLLVRRKEVEPVPSGDRPLDGLQPCEMCEP